MEQHIKELLDRALEARAKAHAPYSKFKVGAAVRAANGNIYAGCNIENVAYPLGQCAETGAISAMIADGQTEITEVVVIGSGDEVCTPCGGCRQRLSEFAGTGVPVYVCGEEGVRLETTLGELLPYAFDIKTGNIEPGNVKSRDA